MESFLNNFLNWIREALTFLVESLGTLIEWFFDAVLFVLKGLAYLFIDGIMIFIKTLIFTIDIPANLLSFAAGYGLIPSQAVYFMNAIGFPQFVTIIAGAYLVRLSLNLIPHVEILGNSVDFNKL
jgi:hypothetical protein